MIAGFSYDTKDTTLHKVNLTIDGKMNTLSFVKTLAEEPLSFEPGAHWQYSLCHDVLAAVSACDVDEAMIQL